MSKLVIKFPTRNRPDKFKNVFEKYISLLSKSHDVEFIVTMDDNDPTMNNESIKNWFEEKKKNTKIQYFYGHSKSKIEACNANMENADGDVLLLASDDMVPVMTGYDDIIFQSFNGVFPDFDGAIKFWDGLRPKEDMLMTLTVMGFPLYRKFGYIYHPAYKSLYCDNEQTQVCVSLGKFAISPLCIIKHDWTPQPFDELHARNENSQMYEIDGKTFAERKAKNFDMEIMNGNTSK